MFLPNWYWRVKTWWFTRKKRGNRETILPLQPLQLPPKYIRSTINLDWFPFPWSETLQKVRFCYQITVLLGCPLELMKNNELACILISYTSCKKIMMSISPPSWRKRWNTWLNLNLTRLPHPAPHPDLSSRNACRDPWSTGHLMTTYCDSTNGIKMTIPRGRTRDPFRSLGSLGERNPGFPANKRTHLR